MFVFILFSSASPHSFDFHKGNNKRVQIDRLEQDWAFHLNRPICAFHPSGFNVFMGVLVIGVLSSTVEFEVFEFLRVPRGREKYGVRRHRWPANLVPVHRR